MRMVLLAFLIVDLLYNSATLPQLFPIPVLQGQVFPLAEKTETEACWPNRCASSVRMPSLT